jgi:hypothetical protein
MPTGTWDDWSDIGESATEDDSLIPPQAQCWLNKVIWSDEGTTLFSDDLLNACVILSLL